LLGLQASLVCPSLNSGFEDNDEFKTIGGVILTGETKVIGEKLVLVPFHSVWKGIFNFMLLCSIGHV